MKNLWRRASTTRRFGAPLPERLQTSSMQEVRFFLRYRFSLSTLESERVCVRGRAASARGIVVDDIKGGERTEDLASRLERDCDLSRPTKVRTTVTDKKAELQVIIAWGQSINFTCFKTSKVSSMCSYLHSGVFFAAKASDKSDKKHQHDRAAAA